MMGLTLGKAILYSSSLSLHSSAIVIFSSDAGIPGVRSMDPDTQNQVFFTTAKILVIVLLSLQSSSYPFHHPLCRYHTPVIISRCFFLLGEKKMKHDLL